MRTSLQISLEPYLPLDHSAKALDPLKLSTKAADPSLAEALYEKGMPLLQSGKLKEALDLFESAFIADPDISTRSYSNDFFSSEITAQVVAHMKHNLNEALHSCNRAIRLNPHSASFHNMKAALLSKGGDALAALESNNKAIELDTHNPAFHNNKGLTLRELGHFDQGLECFNRAIELNSREVVFHANKGLILSDSRRYAEASESYKTALKLDPSNTGALQSLKALSQLSKAASSNSLAHSALPNKQLTKLAGRGVEIDVTQVLSFFALMVLALTSMYCLRRHLTKQAHNPHRLQQGSTVEPRTAETTSARATRARNRRAQVRQAVPAPALSAELGAGARDADTRTSAQVSSTEPALQKPSERARTDSGVAATSTQGNYSEISPFPKAVSEAQSTDATSRADALGNYPETLLPSNCAEEVRGVDAQSGASAYGNYPEDPPSPRPGLL